jgi:4-hydroxy-tetrahydrodipicolinate reductase
MEPIRIMVNGIPGNMAVEVASHAIKDSRFQVIPQSLTGPEISETAYALGPEKFRLLHPKTRDADIAELIKRQGAFICVDYTHPSAVNENAEFYCRNGLAFVMGTTGGDRARLEKTVSDSSIAAVIAPNMAKQIVGFQAMMAYAANTFPDLFKGYGLKVAESHQRGKADTSGTARAMIGHFNGLGTPVSEEDIIMERDPIRQKNSLKVPEAHLKGHAYHTYTLTSGDETVCFQFIHNVNGRGIYAKGTLDAVEYLYGKLRQPVSGTVFTMIDVLKGL